MATKPKRLLGVMRCLCCGEAIPVKEAENGTINAACPWCDFPAWAKAGSKAHGIILARVVKPQGNALPAPAAPAPTPASPAPTAAPRKPAASVFHLGD